MGWIVEWFTGRNQSEQWAIGLVALLVIGIITQWFGQRLNHSLCIERERQSRFKAASAKFISEVHSAFSGLYPHSVNWPENIDAKLRSVFPTLSAAVAEFRPFVPWYRRWFFDRDWFRYRCSTGRQIDVQCYHHYMAFGSNPTYKENFKHNVDNLLKYAKVT